MSLDGAGLRMLLVVLAVGALLLAACAPAEEPAAEPAPEPEPEVDEPVDEQTADEETADEQTADEQTADEQTAEEAEAPGEGVEVTAYVVAYHWGFAIFDEDGSELEQLEVPKGAAVELVAVNDHAGEAIDELPEPVAEAIRADDWHGRAHHDVEMGRIPDPEDEEGVSLSEALDEAHAHGHDLDHHGLMVAGVGGGERVFLDSHASEPKRMEFVADREGVFQFRCTEECGFGHDHQRWELLLVEA